MKQLAKFIATGFGSGLAPFAPGTFGSLLAFLITIGALFTGVNLHVFHVVAIVLSIIIGNWSINVLIPTWGKDPSKIVVDEFVGMWITLLFVPVGILYFFIGFILFRLFDITKILGIRKLESLPNAWGVMADDILAGIYANICLRLLIELEILRFFS